VSQFDTIANLLTEGTQLALEEHLETLRMDNPPEGENYIKIKAMKSKAASDILAIRARVDSQSLKGRNLDRLGSVLKQVREWTPKASEAN
jgi:hypothetical protein